MVGLRQGEFHSKPAVAATGMACVFACCPGHANALSVQPAQEASGLLPNPWQGSSPPPPPKRSQRRWIKARTPRSSLHLPRALANRHPRQQAKAARPTRRGRTPPPSTPQLQRHLQKVRTESPTIAAASRRRRQQRQQRQQRQRPASQRWRKPKPPRVRLPLLHLQQGRLPLAGRWREADHHRRSALQRTPQQGLQQRQALPPRQVARATLPRRRHGLRQRQASQPRRSRHRKWPKPAPSLRPRVAARRPTKPAPVRMPPALPPAPAPLLRLHRAAPKPPAMSANGLRGAAPRLHWVALLGYVDSAGAL